MSPERFAAIRALFDAALGSPVEAREGFLAAGSHPPDIIAEVRALLAASEATDSPLDGAVGDRLGWGPRLLGGGLLGQTLGPYRVIREIGSGGMGTVFEAVRSDEQFTKRVAIKTLRAGGAEMLARFTRERQIQAALAHPHIAALLDAGVTGQGDPYIVLEYVDGVPIDAYCEAHQLGIPARLDLFRQVLQAVQHAHRQQVVHRDLKPTNILVTADGVVKLLDFGISKLLSEDAERTATGGARAFTTAYASPEQIRGELISTSSDIYSLGVVLYRLLTGRHPYMVEAHSPAAAWTAICETPPPPPSAVASDPAARAAGLFTGERLARTLRGELDAIVLMALRKEPDRRYPTVNALDEDIQSYLRGHPVAARPDTAGYRFRKLVRRNPLASAALALAFLAMAAGTGVSIWQARLARAQTQLAEEQRISAERLADFLRGMFSAADAGWRGAGFQLGPNTTILEVIDAAAARLGADLAAEPRVTEELYAILSSTYATLRQGPKAAALARELIRRREQRGADPAEIGMAMQELGTAMWLSGQLDSALVMLRAAYDRFEEAGRPRSEDRVITTSQLGLVLAATGRYRDALPYMTEALTLRQELQGEDAVVAIGYNNLGFVAHATGDLDGAERHYRRAWAVYAAIPDRENYELSVTLTNLAATHLLQGRLPEAEARLADALEVLERTVGLEHPTAATAYQTLARIHLASGRVAEAWRVHQRGVDLLGALPAGHPDLARSETYAAEILLAMGRFAEAEARARDGLATRRQVYVAEDWRIAESQGILGRILRARGRPQEARRHLAESHAGLLAALGTEDPRTRTAQRELALAHGKDGAGPAGRE